MRLDLPAEPSSVPLARHQVVCLMECLGVDPRHVCRARVVVTEACTNAVLHAYDEPGHRYCLRVDVRRDRAVVEVMDWGRRFDARTVPEPAPGQLGGYGVYLIRQVSDATEFSAATEERGSRVVAELRLDGEGDGWLQEDKGSLRSASGGGRGREESRRRVGLDSHPLLACL